MASLGTVTFPYDLYWVTKTGPNLIQGVDRISLDGTLVSIRISPESDPYGEHTFRFEWLGYSGLLALCEYHRSLSTVSITPESGGGTYTCRFLQNKPVKHRPVAPTEGFVHADVLGYATELYNGEFTVFIL